MANRYQRVPMEVAVPAGLQTISYAEVPDASSFEPISPQRIIAGATAVIGVALMAMLLFFGASRNGALDEMPTASRMMMAGFTSVIATVLLLYANPRSRKKAVLFALLCSALLLTLPLVCTEGSVSLKALPADEAPPRVRPPVQTPEQERIAQLRQTIGTDPLTGENAKLATEGSGRHAYGLWLRGLSESNKLLVRDFLLRVADADPSSHPYPRGRNDYLMVVSGVNMTIEKLAELAAPLGEIMQIYREIDIIEVRVNNGNFVVGQIDKLTDQADPAFYELNRRELESIDLERVEGAVKRLKEVAPKLYRNDITRRLIVLLKEDEVKFKDDLCAALMRWADEPAAAADAAEAVLKKMFAEKLPIPREMVALLVKDKRLTIIPIIDELWLGDPGTWEQYYVELGPPIEATLIRHFTEITGGVRRSAVRMLGKVGGPDSLPVLKSARAGADSELLLRIDAAEKSIRERRGE